MKHGNDQSEDVLESEAYRRPRVALLANHDQAKTHILRIRALKDALVTVPIGPGIPRRDKPELYARHCRLMLILFKPWRDARDLRSEGQSWEDAFKTFLLSCSEEVKFKMDNMQILHECRDSRDDHFAEKRYLNRKAVNDVRRHQRINGEDIDDFLGEDVNEEMILDHLEEISQRFSLKKLSSGQAVL